MAVGEADWRCAFILLARRSLFYARAMLTTANLFYLDYLQGVGIL